MFDSPPCRMLAPAKQLCLKTKESAMPFHDAAPSCFLQVARVGKARGGVQGEGRQGTGDANMTSGMRDSNMQEGTSYASWQYPRDVAFHMPAGRKERGGRGRPSEGFTFMNKIYMSRVRNCSQKEMAVASAAPKYPNPAPHTHATNVTLQCTTLLVALHQFLDTCCGRKQSNKILGRHRGQGSLHQP